MKMMPHRRLRYIGLDVHRATIAVAISEEEGSPSSYGTIANDPPAVRKLMTRLGGNDVELRVATRLGRPGTRSIGSSRTSASNASWLRRRSFPCVQVTRSKLIAAMRSSWLGCCEVATSRRSGCLIENMRYSAIWSEHVRTPKPTNSAPNTV